MKISIIIPIYNVAPYIADCLRSVMNQTYQGEIECLLIDDCGTDNSMEVVEDVLKDYHGQIDFRILCHEQNEGLSTARNTGLNHAKGDYVYFLDSDDEIAVDCIDKLARPLNNELYDIVVGGYRIEGSDIWDNPLKISNNSILKGEDIVKSYYYGKWYVMACGKLCNLSFLRKNKLNFKNKLIHEDELWSFQIACSAKSLFVVNEETYIYKLRLGSITTQNKDTRLQRLVAFYEILNEMVDYVIDRGYESNYSYWKIFNISNTIYQLALVGVGNQDIYKQCRLVLSKLPYANRLKSCLSNIKILLLNGYILLPKFFSSWYICIVWKLQFLKTKLSLIIKTLCQK